MALDKWIAVIFLVISIMYGYASYTYPLLPFERRSSSVRRSQFAGYPPYGLVSTLFHHISSWPGEWVQVDLHAIVHVWQPMHRLMLKTAAN